MVLRVYSRHLANTIGLVFPRPTKVHNPTGKSIDSAVLAQIMAESPYTYNGLCFPQKLLFPMRDLDRHLIHRSLGPLESSTQTASRTVQPFLHRRLQSVPILYNGTPLPPLKIAPFHGDLDLHLIMVLCAHPSPQPKRHLDRFSRFCRAH